MNARGMIVAAALICTAAGCASTPRGAREEEYQFSGHTLKVQLDDGGLPVSARAFDKDRKEIPTALGPARDVTVCVPKAGGGQQCEPFLYMPDRTFFKAGTGTICFMWIGTTLIRYQC